MLQHVLRDKSSGWMVTTMGSVGAFLMSLGAFLFSMQVCFDIRWPTRVTAP